VQLVFVQIIVQMPDFSLQRGFADEILFAKDRRDDKSFKENIGINIVG
jgi:hypothetical protein